MVTASRIKDISETYPLPRWPFTLKPYTLTFAGRIWSQILYIFLGEWRRLSLPSKFTHPSTQLAMV